MAQSSNITKSITVSDAIADAISRMKTETTAVVQPDGTLAGDFTGFVFADNPANNLAEWLEVAGVVYKGCSLNGNGTVSVPDNDLAEGETVRVLELAPFFYDGILKDLNMSELAYPAIVLPRPQRQQVLFGSAAATKTEINLTLMFVDYADHIGWTQPTIGQLVNATENEFTTYVERPLYAIVRKFIDAISWQQITIGDKTSTITVSEDKESPVGELMFVPKFGSDPALSDMGFDENLAGYVFNFDLTIHNDACL